MNPVNTETWKVKSQELAKTTPSSCSTSSPLRLHIPKLMPMIPFGTPKVTNASVSDGCFCNDKACKPSISKSIGTQNYVTVPIYDNNDFICSIFYQGARIKVDFFNGSVDEIYATNRIDESVCP